MTEDYFEQRASSESIFSSVPAGMTLTSLSPVALRADVMQQSRLFRSPFDTGEHVGLEVGGRDRPRSAGEFCHRNREVAVSTTDVQAMVVGPDHVLENSVRLLNKAPQGVVEGSDEPPGTDTPPWRGRFRDVHGNSPCPYIHSDIDQRGDPNVSFVLLQEMQKLTVGGQGHIEIMPASDAVKEEDQEGISLHGVLHQSD